MNYTNANNENYEDTPQDWLNSALIFSRALGLLLDENEGIIVDLKGDAKFMPDPTVNKVIVFKRENQIVIEECDPDREEGDMCLVFPPTNPN